MSRFRTKITPYGTFDDDSDFETRRDEEPFIHPSNLDPETTQRMIREDVARELSLYYLLGLIALGVFLFAALVVYVVHLITGKEQL